MAIKCTFANRKISGLSPLHPGDRDPWEAGAEHRPLCSIQQQRPPWAPKRVRGNGPHVSAILTEPLKWIWAEVLRSGALPHQRWYLWPVEHMVAFPSELDVLLFPIQLPVSPVLEETLFPQNFLGLCLQHILYPCPSITL